MSHRVSILVMGHPQFETQDDYGVGPGIPPISEWRLPPAEPKEDAAELTDANVRHEVRNVFFRLRNIFKRAERIPFPTTQLHDLTCFVIHRLLLTIPDVESGQQSPLTECVRYAIILYMFIVHGPTYYSHAVILNTMIVRFIDYLELIGPGSLSDGLFDVWFVAIGMVSSTGTAHHQWFVGRAKSVAESMPLENWDEALVRIRHFLWLETPQGEDIFRPHWDIIFGTGSHSASPDTNFWASPGRTGTSILRNTVSPARMLPGRLEAAIQMDGNHA
jgi:hypothetical protein